MINAPPYTELAEAAGISRSYAHQIASGTRTPPLALAVHIGRQTGWKHPTIALLSDEQIAAMAESNPWSPRPTPEGLAA